LPRRTLRAANPARRFIKKAMSGCVRCPTRITRASGRLFVAAFELVDSDHSVARRNGFTIRPEMLSVFRTLVAVETSPCGSTCRPPPVDGSGGREGHHSRRRVRPRRTVRIRAALVDLLASLNNAPEHLNQILTDSANGGSASASMRPSIRTSRRHATGVTGSCPGARGVGISWLMGEPDFRHWDRYRLPFLAPYSRSSISVCRALAQIG